MSLKLYNYFRSSTSYRVRIALHLKNLSFDYIPVHLLKDGGEQNKSTYRELNPIGGVPTLVHNSLILGQSTAILEYLDENFPYSFQLFPKEPQQKAKVRQFCQIINADTHAYGNLRTLQYLEKNLQATEEQKKTWVQHWITEGLTACERSLSQNHKMKYAFHHNSITAAEVLLIPQIFTAQRFEVDLKPFPQLMRINDECLKIPAFQMAHPFRQIDTPEELRIK